MLQQTQLSNTIMSEHKTCFECLRQEFETNHSSNDILFYYGSPAFRCYLTKEMNWNEHNKGWNSLDDNGAPKYSSAPCTIPIDYMTGLFQDNEIQRQYEAYIEPRRTCDNFFERTQGRFTALKLQLHNLRRDDVITRDTENKIWGLIDSEENFSEEDYSTLYVST